MRNRIRALIDEGILDIPQPVGSVAGAEAGARREHADDFAGIPGLRLLAEIPRVDEGLRPGERRRAALEFHPEREDDPSYALDPMPEDAHSIDVRRHHLRRAGFLRQARYWCAVVICVGGPVAAGLLLLG